MIGAINQKICIESYCLANPNYIYLIIPLGFILILLTKIVFVKFKKNEEKQNFIKEHRFDRIIFTLLRSFVFLLLLIAIASPYQIRETTTEGNPSLMILADNSSSFQVFNSTIAPKLKAELEKYFPVTLKYIASGERSAIGDGILQNAEGDDHILVVSDGYNNYGRDLGDIILLSSILNTTIHTLKLNPLKKDVSVTIDGPSQVIEMSENTFKVNINNVGNTIYNKVEVFVDGDPVGIDNEGKFNWRFQRGYHKIMARIIFPQDDYFEQNNFYYKSVKALPRPKLLYVTEKEGPLQEALEKVYDVTVKDSLPDDLNSYDAVIINNIDANKISNNKVDLLSEYVSEKGKGLVVVGGENSFDQGNYKNSYFETILPVQVGVAKRERDTRNNIVFLIDISGTTGFRFSESHPETVIDFEKAFLQSIIKSLNQEDKIALIAYVKERYCIPKELGCNLAPLSSIPNIYELIEKLTIPYYLDEEGRLVTPGTSIDTGLMRARHSLEKAAGSKDVVVLTDGIFDDPSSQVKIMASFGIKLYTIGVGQHVNSQLLKKMAEIGGGMYFEPDDVEKLKIIFMGDEEKCLKLSKGKLVLMDTSHWITKGNLMLNAEVGGYNLIVPKLWGRKLLATDCDKTIITVGRYGLGSVAVLSTDDGSKWSGQLFTKENSKIITKMVNWAIGDFTKNMEFDVRIKDTTLGKSTEVNVISNEKPEEKGLKALEFVKVDAGLYSATFRPEKEGFYQILRATTAVSYNDEYEKIGINPKLEELVTISGGKIFNPNNVEHIKDTIIKMSRRIKIETINYRWPFVIAALILFLVDILIRRIRENRQKF